MGIQTKKVVGRKHNTATAQGPKNWLLYPATTKRRRTEAIQKTVKAVRLIRLK